MTSNRGIWIQYVANPEQDLPQDLQRKMRLADGGFTWLIDEAWDYSSGPLPKAGDRPPIFCYPTAPREGQSRDAKGRLGDWVVTKIALYQGSEEGEFDAIAVCTCHYDPIPLAEQVWRDVPRGVPLTEAAGHDVSLPEIDRELASIT